VGFLQTMSILPNLLPLIYLAAHSVLTAGSRRLGSRRKRRILAVDAALTAGMAILLAWFASFESAPRGWRGILLLWSPLIFFWGAYLWNRPILEAVHPESRTVDPWLMRLDGRLFGQPSLWLARRGGPWTTEVLHAFYAGYYLYTPVLGVWLHTTRTAAEFQAMAFAVCLGYLISYLLFILVPARGPRWHLVETGLVPASEQRRPGFAATRFVHRLMYDGPALKGGAMPSSHSSTAVVFLVWNWRLGGPEAGAVAAVLVVGMWLGSIHGRYHWVGDVVAGALLGLAAVLVGDHLILAR